MRFIFRVSSIIYPMSQCFVFVSCHYFLSCCPRAFHILLQLLVPHFLLIFLDACFLT